MEGQAQNRTEEATPFRLRKAREKGQVARGMDLGFVGSLLALALFILVAGSQFMGTLAQLMRATISVGMDGATSPGNILAVAGAAYRAAIKPLFFFGLTIMVTIIVLELIQLRGIVFSAHPLKPDFTRLNPAKGLKRLFSLKMLKETFKSILKLAVYSGTATLLIWGAVESFGSTLFDSRQLLVAMESSGKKLLFTFIAIAFFFMVIDQLIVRREFRKQMRMSRRDVTRENKEQEGEPRFKQKRKDLHQQMRQQVESLGQVQGSDVIITNPEHFAVALHYDAETMDAPVIRARGRNHFAQLMKRKARLVFVPVIANPVLARALYHDGRKGEPVPSHLYRDVAKIYMKLRQNQGAQDI